MKKLLVLSAAAVTALAAAGCSSSHSGSPAPQAKPNIVMVLTDDLSWNLVSHMPAVQALQQAGTTMGSYDVVDSLCCPSRTAIFTGEYPHDDGVFTNTGSDGGYGAYQAHDDATASFAPALQKVGYTTAFMGKYLNGYQPSDPIPAGWDEWDVAGNGYPEFDYTLNEDGKQVHYGHQPSDYLVDVLSQKADAFVTSNAGKPFLLEVATFAPHAPYTPAPRYATAAEGLGYPKTPAYDTLPTDPPSWLGSRAPLTAKQQSAITTDYDKRVEADMAVDDLITNLRKTLQDKGIAGDTYLVFTSDNGYHMGEYRLTPGKQTAFDTDIHVPLVVVGPGVPAGRTAHEMVSEVDLAPTYEQLAGAPVGGAVDGISMAGIWHGEQPAGWPQAVLVEHHGPDDTPGDPDAQTKAAADPPSYEAIRTATALYVRYADGEQEYYDTATDPDELHDLAGQGIPAGLPKVLAAMESCHGATACVAAAQLPSS